MTHPAGRFIERLGLSHGIAVFGAVFMIAVVVVLTNHLAEMRHTLLDERIDDARIHAQAIEGRVARSLDAAAFTLHRIHDHIELNPTADRPGDSGFRDALTAMTQRLPFAATVLVVDAEGGVVHEAPGADHAGLNVSPLAYFRAHRDGVRDVLVSPPFRSRVDGGWLMPVSLGSHDAEGTLTGVIAIAVPLEHFRAAFEPARRAGLDAAAIHFADGRLAVSMPFDPDVLGLVFPEATRLGEGADARRQGAAIRASPIDGVERLLAWRGVSGWPLLVTVGMDAQRLHAEARQTGWRYVSSALVVCVIIAVLISLLVRQLERRQAAEERVRNAIDNISEAFALVGPDDRLVLCTAAYARLYAADERPERLLGRGFEELVRLSLANGEKPGPGFSDEEWIAERVRRHRNPPPTPHVQHLAGDRWVQVSERRLPDGSTVGVRSDITTIKQREKQLEHARRDAELANRAKSRFLAAMSHELRTPLNAILGFSEIIRDLRFGRSPVERYAAYAADIHRSGEHLLDLINDLLDMSKIEAGRYSLNEQGLEIGAVIEHCVGMLRERARSGGVALTLEPAGGLPLLHADERALRQVLLNVLSNAVKFTPPGGRANIAAQLEADGRLAVIVRDTGIGIPAKARPRLFQPFAQADSALVREREGTGLGLAISRALVELHGGTITLDSEEGHGTTVTVRFPRERVLATLVPRRRVAAG